MKSETHVRNYVDKKEQITGKNDEKRAYINITKRKDVKKTKNNKKIKIIKK